MCERSGHRGLDLVRRRHLWFALATALATVHMTSRTSHLAEATQVPGPPPATTPANSDQDLITRYRFSERYRAKVDALKDDEIGQYRVSINESVIPSFVAPAQDAKGLAAPPPLRVNDVVYTELAAEIGALSQVRSVVRRYEKAAAPPAGDVKSIAPQSLEGVTIWYRPQFDDLPQVICMSSDRSLTEDDYRFAAHQLFVPDLGNALPPTPLRIGDTWVLSKLGVRTLVAGQKILQGGLVGKLVEVRTDARSSNRIAVLDVSGRVTVVNGMLLQRVGVRAQIEFAFSNKRPAGKSAGRTKEDATIDARGAIIRLRLAVAGTSQSDISKKPRDIKRELFLDRELAKTRDPIIIPPELPRPTPKNSWLTYVDPQGRYQFRHPQELYHPQDVGLPATVGPDKVELVHQRSGRQGADHVIVAFLPMAQRTPEEVQAAVLSSWKSKGIVEADILRGAFGWLPEADWPGMKVYRFESAIVLRGRSTRGIERIHEDCYLAQLPQDSTLIVEATTDVDPPIQLQKDIEGMLKSFRLSAPGS
jgi:hypothetical protein